MASLGVTFELVDESYEESLSEADRAYVEKKIGEAERELISMIPDLETRITENRIDAQLVIDKVVAAVLRVVRNPKGIETEDEGDYGVKLRNTVASGDIWYPEKDLLQLGWQGKTQSSMPRTVKVTASRGWGFP